MNFCKVFKIDISFETYKFNNCFIRGLNLNRVRTQQCNWKREKTSLSNPLLKYFICDLDFLDARPVITIKSPISIQNRTSAHFKITICDDELESMDFSLSSDEELSVPLEYAENESEFRIYFDSKDENSNFAS